ncbi:MAG: hypothetical protein ABEJ35_02255 [Halobacteriaceae archaeon]
MDYRELLFLRAVRDTGMLEAIVTSAGTAREVADATGLAESVADGALDVLVELGYLTVVDDIYEPTNALLGILAQRDVRSIGELPANLALADDLVALPATMTGEQPPSQSGDDVMAQLGAAAATDTATVRAIATAVVRAAPTATTALVLAGAPGRVAVELQARGLAVTVADTPAAIDASEGVLGPAAVETIVREPDTTLPTAPLVVVEASRRHRETPLAEALSAAAMAVAEDGTLVLVGPDNEAAGGPEDPRPLAAIEHLARTGSWPDPTLEGVDTTLASAGLERTDVAAIPGTALVAIAARPSSAGD